MLVRSVGLEKKTSGFGNGTIVKSGSSTDGSVEITRLNLGSVTECAWFLFTALGFAPLFAKKKWNKENKYLRRSSLVSLHLEWFKDKTVS